MLEDMLVSWTGRLEGVLGQEVGRPGRSLTRCPDQVTRARELTGWAKEALRQAEHGGQSERYFDKLFLKNSTKIKQF